MTARSPGKDNLLQLALMVGHGNQPTHPETCPQGQYELKPIGEEASCLASPTEPSCITTPEESLEQASVKYLEDDVPPQHHSNQDNPGSMEEAKEIPCQPAPTTRRKSSLKRVGSRQKSTATVRFKSVEDNDEGCAGNAYQCLSSNTSTDTDRELHATESVNSITRTSSLTTCEHPQGAIQALRTGLAEESSAATECMSTAGERVEIQASRSVTAKMSAAHHGEYQHLSATSSAVSLSSKAPILQDVHDSMLTQSEHTTTQNRQRTGTMLEEGSITDDASPQLFSHRHHQQDLNNNSAQTVDSEACATSDEPNHVETLWNKTTSSEVPVPKTVDAEQAVAGLAERRRRFVSQSLHPVQSEDATATAESASSSTGPSQGEMKFVQHSPGSDPLSSFAECDSSDEEPSGNHPNSRNTEVARKQGTEGQGTHLAAEPQKQRDSQCTSDRVQSFRARMAKFFNSISSVASSTDDLSVECSGKCRQPSWLQSGGRSNDSRGLGDIQLQPLGQGVDSPICIARALPIRSGTIEDCPTHPAADGDITPTSSKPPTAALAEGAGEQLRITPAAEQPNRTTTETTQSLNASLATKVHDSNETPFTGTGGAARKQAGKLARSPLTSRAWTRTETFLSTDSDPARAGAAGTPWLTESSGKGTGLRSPAHRQLVRTPVLPAQNIEVILTKPVDSRSSSSQTSASGTLSDDRGDMAGAPALTSKVISSGSTRSLRSLQLRRTLFAQTLASPAERDGRPRWEFCSADSQRSRLAGISLALSSVGVSSGMSSPTLPPSRSWSTTPRSSQSGGGGGGGGNSATSLA
eukprot:scpid51762/ scgid16425/ 